MMEIEKQAIKACFFKFRFIFSPNTVFWDFTLIQPSDFSSVLLLNSVSAIPSAISLGLSLALLFNSVSDFPLVISSEFSLVLSFNSVPDFPLESSFEFSLEFSLVSVSDFASNHPSNSLWNSP